MRGPIRAILFAIVKAANAPHPAPSQPLSAPMEMWIGRVRSRISPGELHIHAATLDDAAQYAPTSHCVYEEHAPWLSQLEDIPKDASFSHAPVATGGPDGAR